MGEGVGVGEEAFQEEGVARVRASARARDAVVAVDCNGADLGPTEVAAGAVLAAAEGASTILFGPATELNAALEAAGCPVPGADGAPAPVGSDGGAIAIVDAPVSIAKSADPVRAARGRPDASIVQAARALADGHAQALVCAGGTGAALAAGLFNVKRAPGIHRPALALPLPVPGRPVTLLDVGANTQARPEHLEQFAFMGAALARTVLGVERPRVGLLSNGQEAERGSPLIVAAHARLRARAGDRPSGRAGAGTLAGAGAGAGGDGGGDGKEDAGAWVDAGGGPEEDAVAWADAGAGAGYEPLFELIGNVEGGDLVSGTADVIVTDGLTGNVALKVMEGVSQTLLGAIRQAALSSTTAKLGGVLLRGALAGLRAEIDPEAQGGAYLLGLRGLAVVPHGAFKRNGFAQAILRARRGAREDVVGRTHAALAAAGALRRAPVSARAASLPGDDA